MKKAKNIIYKLNMLIPLIIIIILSIYIFNSYKYTYKYIFGTIIKENDSYIEIITKNDSIYKFNYYSDKYKVGDNIRIKYTNNLSNFKDLQDVNIKALKKAEFTSNYSRQALNILKSMSLEEKIGQLLLVRTPVSNKIETIKEYKIGGYILFNRDIENKTKQDLINDINSFQSASKIPLLIAIDEEGGSVSRLSSNKKIVSTPFLSPQELYKLGGYNEIKKDAINKVELLSELGINVNLAPVVDITTNQDSYMYNRSFGKDKNETSKYAQIILSTQNDKVSYVLKHFPGYGDNVDTHTKIAIDNRPYKEIKNNDFLPFKVGIDNGAKAILVSHNISTSIDKKPSSLSRNIHNILRNELNFNGIIITDDLSMSAIKGYETKTPYIDAILAGNNILIVSDYKSAYDEIYTGIIDDKISEKLIDRLVLKNIDFKINKKLYK